MRAAVRFAPALIVGLLLSIFVFRYPRAYPPSQAISWIAVHRFFSDDFRLAGFHVECDEGSQGPLECRVLWNGAPDSKGAPPVVVYRGYDDRERRRDDVLSEFRSAAERAGMTERVEDTQAVGVLDGFFHSGLRRALDQAVSHARRHPKSGGFLRPFVLSDERRNGTVRDVVALDATFGSISTGLPERPAYRGQFLAHAGAVAAGDTEDTVAVRIPPGSGAAKTPARGADGAPREATTALLNPRAERALAPLWPGAPSAYLPGRSAHVNAPSGGSDASLTPVVELYALPKGRVLVRAGDTNGRPVTAEPGGEGTRLKIDELTALAPEDGMPARLFVGGADPGHPGFAIEFLRSGSVPVSLVRMVNGRWERSHDAAVERWLSPLIASTYEKLAARKRIPPEENVHLALNLSLQRDLEAALSRWMAPHEQEVRRHLASVHYTKRAHSLDPLPGEKQHVRAAPRAGVTVLEVPSGRILAVASYPPPGSVEERQGEYEFGPGWQTYLCGASAPAWAVRDVLDALTDSVVDEGNSNFARHPIGSAFKPILLSLMMDRKPPDGAPDGVDRLFNLVVSGHGGNGGDAEREHLRCPECRDAAVEAVSGLPIGPWGTEEARGHGGAWIDRREFLIHSCNKYAVTLGMLSLLDWAAPRGNTDACCFNAARDGFGFSEEYWPWAVGAEASPGEAARVRSAEDLPPLGPWIRAAGKNLQSHQEFANAPAFRRLEAYYDVTPRSEDRVYDPTPWLDCEGLAQFRGPAAGGAAQGPPAAGGLPADIEIGRVVKTQLLLTQQPTTSAFSIFFTGSYPNWWTNVKLAEAYARIASNRRIRASFADAAASDAGAADAGVVDAGAAEPAPLFASSARHGELTAILSKQREASWVHTDRIDRWEAKEKDARLVLSKTGTATFDEPYKDTGVFAVFIGEKAVSGDDGMPRRAGRGVVVVVHVEDIGHSSEATRLADELFPILETRLGP